MGEAQKATEGLGIRNDDVDEPSDINVSSGQALRVVLLKNHHR